MKGGFKWLMFLSHSIEARKLIEKYNGIHLQAEGFHRAVVVNRLMRELGQIYRQRGNLPGEERR